MTAETDEPFPGVRFVTVEELAAVMRMSKMTVYRLVKDKKIAARRPGRLIRIPVADARALVNGNEGDE